MSARPRPIELSFDPPDNRRLAALCGAHDEHLHQIEEYLGVEIASRGNVFRISGDVGNSRSAEKLLRELYEVTARGESVTAAGLHTVLQRFALRPAGEEVEVDEETRLRTPKRMVQPRTANQREYVRRILTHDINLGVGPAGTGKTYLAVACAVEALESSRVSRILLVRPVVEAGERLGFLPGALEEKVDPYLRPLYDALHEMLGFEKVARLLERHVIEIAPLAYMRGRTLNESFIILDEAQNTTAEQMKMFLTRIGFGTTAVITGDITQIDLKRGQTSGLKQALEILQGVEGITITHFTPRDVVRHALVARIVEAYERFDAQTPRAADEK